MRAVRVWKMDRGYDGKKDSAPEKFKIQILNLPEPEKFN